MPFGGQSRSTDDIVLKAASAEQLSSHPAAQALLRAEERKLGVRQDSQERVHFGRTNIKHR